MSGSALPSRPTPLTPRKRAILVGASSGIGAALARRLAFEGWTLALLARRADRLQALCEEINTAAGETRAVYYVHDVTDFAAAEPLLRRIVADLGGLEMIIYNAGVLMRSDFYQYDFEADRRMAEVNYLGALAWLDPAAMLFQGQGQGIIVGISSVAGDRGRVKNPGYNASKAALTCYLEALRNRLTRQGIHVLTVKPGYVATEMTSGQKAALPVASPEQVAADISRAIRRRTQTLYTPWFWGPIMLIVRHIPSFIFRHLNF